MYTISLLFEAIKDKKRVAFKVIDYDKNGNEVYRLNGFVYKVSPYFLVNNTGRYYLLCNYRADYKTLNTFRIDYLKDIEIMENDKNLQYSSFFLYREFYKISFFKNIFNIFSFVLLRNK